MVDTSAQRVVRVVGHKNPDTDSICSAISYAYLKNQISDQHHEPRRAGEINRETRFVLNHFGASVPKLSVDLSPTISYVDIRQEPGVDEEMPIRDAWQRMFERNIDTLCITSRDNDLKGLITVRDIANANMDLFHTEVLAESHTSYKNLIQVLNGKMLTGDPDGNITSGKINIGTSPEAMEDQVKPGDLVMVTNRYEAQMCAIDYGASCLIVCLNAEVPAKLLERAAQYHCTIIQTPYDSYATSRLVSMAVPVRHFMRKTEELLTFKLDTPVDEARKVMANVRHRYFPVLDREGKYCGVVSRRNMMNVHRKKVILVDHNEKSQAVDGLEEAEILEIIDHHRIGNLETSSPVFFRNEPVGCTATILYEMYEENHVEIPKNIAGLMLSAILSDTLLFHSPTCTMFDKQAAKELSSICGENIEEYGEKMFEAGEDLTGRDADDLLHSDYKEFNIGDMTISVGQGIFMSEKAYEQAGDMVQNILVDEVEKSHNSMIFYMLTSISKQSSDLIFAGKGADELVENAFHVKMNNGRAFLKGVVSRKKQLIPPLREAILSLS